MMHYDPSQALARIDNDVPLLCILIDIFLKEHTKYSDNLLNALEQQQWSTLAEAAHTVKGAAAAIGLEPVREAAAKVEMLCKHLGENDASSCQQKTQELLLTLQQCPPTLQAWVRKCNHGM